jgi:predicted RNase H-like HicB family nuclease
VKEYLVIYERAESTWTAYAPDVPGCMATGDTREEVERNFKEALAFHLEGLREHGLPMPEPSSEAGRVAVPA